MAQMIKCPICNQDNKATRYFCKQCGALLDTTAYYNKEAYEEKQLKMMRLLENIDKAPHSPIVWNDTVDLYKNKVERYKALLALKERKGQHDIVDKMKDFLDLCIDVEFMETEDKATLDNAIEQQYKNIVFKLRNINNIENTEDFIKLSNDKLNEMKAKLKEQKKDDDDLETVLKAVEKSTKRNLRKFQRNFKESLL